jgi:FtsZ-binding cell division protein ZapB
MTYEQASEDFEEKLNNFGKTAEEYKGVLDELISTEEQRIKKNKAALDDSIKLKELNIEGINGKEGLLSQRNQKIQERADLQRKNEELKQFTPLKWFDGIERNI